MVPRGIGAELRRRRVQMGLTQAQIAKAMVAEGLHATRAYVSDVERGVSYDPDPRKLRVWAKTLGWDPDYILRRLGRLGGDAVEPLRLTREQMAEIRDAVAAGVRLAIEEVLGPGRAEGPQRPDPSPTQ